MSAQIVQLDEHRPMQFLFSVAVYRLHDGSPFAALSSANVEWVDATGSSAAERMQIAADLLREAIPHIERQARELAEVSA